MWSLRLRMYLLIAAFFAIIFAIVNVLGYYLGLAGNFTFYAIATLGIVFLQYMIGPKIVEWSMKVKYIEKGSNPKLEKMIEELARAAKIPVPRIGMAQISVPNAFAFGRGRGDGRICVTEGITRLLDEDEMRAVLGHEMSHLKNRDVLTITLLSVVPMILYRVWWHFMFFGRQSRERNQSNAALIGLAALVFYFITNLLVLYVSRIREYFADKGSVDLGNPPSKLASALYKLVYGSARMSKEAIKDVEGVKAFFVNDPSRAAVEFNELKALDMDRSGSISKEELAAINVKAVNLNIGDRLLELMSTHPNMLKRIKRLSEWDERA